MLRPRTLVLALTLPLPLLGATWAVDPARSSITVHVGKTGLLSGLGDTHEVRAAAITGEVSDAPSVEVTVDARKMTVLDPQLSEKKRAEVQRRMLGPEVLDVASHPEIRFRSTKVTPRDRSRWRVEGTLELRGRSGPVAFDVTREGEVFRGEAKVRQTAFGITPITAGAGTVKVKDELTIDLAITITGSAAAPAPAR